MLATTPEYKAAIYAPSRSIQARVIFDLSDVTAEDDVTGYIASNQLTAMSNASQVNNDVVQETYKLATLEQDRFKLDGSLSFPDDSLANNGEVGWVGSEVSSASGTYLATPTLTINFGTTHDSIGVTILFGDGEWAEEFQVIAYNPAGAIVADSGVILGNTASSYPLSMDMVGYNKIVMSIFKWGIPYRRARVLEFDFGLVMTYDGDELISLTLVEDMDIASGTLPSPEFKFTINNQDRAFNILNPTGFYKFLQQRQLIKLELGLETAPGVYEYLPGGEYLLWEWTSEEGSLTASFTTRTNLDLLATRSAENLTGTFRTLYAIAEDIFEYCGITNFYIDPALHLINSQSRHKKLDCKILLQMTAIAGLCNVFVDRTGKIVVKQLAIGAPVDDIDFDNTYEEPKIELERTVKSVAVTYWTDTETAGGVYTTTDPSVEIGDVLELTDNTFIDTAARAQAVAEWILAQKRYRAKYTANWRGNPAQELADVVAIENSYRVTANAMITRNELTYAGYLEARTEAKGAVT